jgi:hypothetical protein
MVVVVLTFFLKKKVGEIENSFAPGKILSKK